jgi:hypothetical protein
VSEPYRKGYKITPNGGAEIFTPCPTVAWEWKASPSAKVVEVAMDGPEHDPDECKTCVQYMS